MYEIQRLAHHCWRNSRGRRKIDISVSLWEQQIRLCKAAETETICCHLRRQPTSSADLITSNSLTLLGDVTRQLRHCSCRRTREITSEFHVYVSFYYLVSSSICFFLNFLTLVYYFFAKLIAVICRLYYVHSEPYEFVLFLLRDACNNAEDWLRRRAVSVYHVRVLCQNG